jgi:hypothetical protein
VKSPCPDHDAAPVGWGTSPRPVITHYRGSAAPGGQAIIAGPWSAFCPRPEECRASGRQWAMRLYLLPNLHRICRCKRRSLTIYVPSRREGSLGSQWREHGRLCGGPPLPWRGSDDPGVDRRRPPHIAHDANGVVPALHHTRGLIALISLHLLRPLCARDMAARRRACVGRPQRGRLPAHHRSISACLLSLLPRTVRAAAVLLLDHVRINRAGELGNAFEQRARRPLRHDARDREGGVEFVGFAPGQAAFAALEDKLAASRREIDIADPDT